jgi:hypothetical protein
MNLDIIKKVFVSPHFSHIGSFNAWTCIPILFGHTTFDKDKMFDYHFNKQILHLNNGLEIEVLNPNVKENLNEIPNEDDIVTIFYWNNYTDDNWNRLLKFIDEHDKNEILVFSYVSDPTLTGNPHHHVNSETLDQFLGKKVRFVSAFPHSKHPNYIYSLEAAYLWWAHPDIRFTEMCMLASNICQYLHVPKRISGYFGKPRWDRLEFYRECKDSLNENFSLYCAFPGETRLEGRDMGDTSDVYDIPKPPDFFEYISEKNHYSNLFYMKSDVLYTHILLGANISILFESNNCENEAELLKRWCWSEKGLGHLLLGKPFLPIEASSYLAQKQMGILHPKVIHYYENVANILDFSTKDYSKTLYKHIHNFIKQILAMPEIEYNQFYKEWIRICQPAKEKIKQNFKDGILKSVIDEENSLYNS